MIKQGSGMALCLKYVTNKVPSLTPLIVNRTRVSVCARQLSKHYAKSPTVYECVGSSGFSPIFTHPDHESTGDLVKGQSKVLRFKCNSDVIRYISHLIFDCKESSKPSNTPSRQCAVSYDTYNCNACAFGIPYSGTPDDLKFIGICDLNNNKYLHSLRRTEKTPYLLSGVGLHNSTPVIGKDHNNQRTEKENQDPFKPPSEEQLDSVLKTLAQDLPRFFVQALDYKIYHPNIVFEDNIRGKRFCGIDQYNLQAKLFYIGGHIRFMYVKLDVLKITSHPEDGTVKVRWKISVLRLRKLWRIKLWELSTSLQDAKETWLDGFSTYYVMGDGLVHRHVADKMIPDRDQLLKKAEPKTVPVANPLAYADRNKI